MSEFKLQSPPRHRVHLYVNPYTHDYEITDIPQSIKFNISDTTWDHFFPTILYQEKMFFTASAIKLWINQRWKNDMERMENEQIFVLRATKQDTGLEIVQTKKNRHGPPFWSTWIHTVMN